MIQFLSNLGWIFKTVQPLPQPLVKPILILVVTNKNWRYCYFQDAVPAALKESSQKVAVQQIFLKIAFGGSGDKGYIVINKIPCDVIQEGK